MSESYNSTTVVDFTFEVLPYQFEPLARIRVRPRDEDLETDSEEENQNIQNDEFAERIGNTDWCDCNNCIPMPTGIESKCCLEINLVENKTEKAGIGCICDHHSFIVNCLNRDVLEVSMIEFAQTDGPLDDNIPPHKMYRYVAYRRFVRWIWHKLPKKMRKVLPSCVVHKIRQTFPSQDYVGFQYAMP